MPKNQERATKGADSRPQEATTPEAYTQVRRGLAPDENAEDGPLAALSDLEAELRGIAALLRHLSPDASLTPIHLHGLGLTLDAIAGRIEALDLKYSETQEAGDAG